jgi:hypothetical protein
LLYNSDMVFVPSFAAGSVCCEEGAGKSFGVE